MASIPKTSLKAGLFGGINGLLSINCILMNAAVYGTVFKSIVWNTFLALVTGGSLIALSEYLSVSSEVDIQETRDIEQNEKLKPFQDAAVAFLSYLLAAVIPVVPVTIVHQFLPRILVLFAVMTLGLLIFGCLEAALDGISAWRSIFRALIGGWIFMGISYGAINLVETKGQV